MSTSKLIIVSDNTLDQVNGVNVTYKKISEIIPYKVCNITPEKFFNVSWPFYPEIKISLNVYKMGKYIEEESPNYIHIATEGPLGLAAKIYCEMNRYRYTTAYHTKFPEYIQQRTKDVVKADSSVKYFKWFHKGSSKVFVATESLEKDLIEWGLERTCLWTRGVSSDIFNTEGRKANLLFKKPIWVTCSRISQEKNIEDFLSAKLIGTKIVIGDGPEREKLERKYPNTIFMGKLGHKEIAEIFRACDCFVFPSKTETFGIVIVEALACGLPVVGYNVTGPKDILTEDTGILVEEKENLGAKCLTALSINKQKCAELGRKYSWENSARIFCENLVDI